jgi:hypothetical protein
MSISKIIENLNSQLEIEKKKKRILDSLITSKKISQNTFNYMYKRIGYKTSVISELKKTFIEENQFINNLFLEKTRILEYLLVDFQQRHLLGEINSDEWTKKSTTLCLGLGLKEPLNFKKNKNIQTKKNIEIALPLKKSEKENKVNPEKIKIEPQKNSNKHKTTIKQKTKLDKVSTIKIHCMNPFKSECQRTDISLSIYFKGEMTPICHKCWEDLSQKNFEW